MEPAPPSALVRANKIALITMLVSMGVLLSIFIPVPDVWCDSRLVTVFFKPLWVLAAIVAFVTAIVAIPLSLIGLARSRGRLRAIVPAVTSGLAAIAAFGVFTYAYIGFTNWLADLYTPPRMAPLVIEHLKLNDGCWPRSWEDLRKTYVALERRGEPLMSWDYMKEIVEIDFNADPAELTKMKPVDGRAPFSVINARRWKIEHWPSPGLDPNQQIFDYLRSKGGQQNTAAGFSWPNQPPKDCPFPQSEQFVGVYFTGQRLDRNYGDTWYPTWASDGNLYSPWTDGTTEGAGSFSIGEAATTGNAVMIGDDPRSLVVKNTSPPQKASPQPYGGRYPCGSLVHNGVWYYGTYCLGPSPEVKHEGFTYNWPVMGPMPGFRVSTDFGKTWTPSPLSAERPLFPEPAKFMGTLKMGAPHFADFGKNMEHSPDGKAYLLGIGAEENDPKPRFANLSWGTADQVYLARVTPSVENINAIAKYEFFAGHDKEGKPVWTGDFARIEPLLDWNNNLGIATVTYNAPLMKYLMCVTDGWPTCAKMSTYILEADAITGPWRLIVYMKDFGEQAYFVNIPSKFISADGRTMWLCYSANFASDWNGMSLGINPPGGCYGLCLHEFRLLGAGEKTPDEKGDGHAYLDPSTSRLGSRHRRPSLPQQHVRHAALPETSMTASSRQ